MPPRMVSLPAFNDIASVFKKGYSVITASTIMTRELQVWKTTGSSRSVLVLISYHPQISLSSPKRLAIVFATKINVMLTIVLKIPAAVASE